MSPMPLPLRLTSLIAAERNTAFIVPSIGGFCLLLTAVWKSFVIRGEMKREAEETGNLHDESSSSSTDGTLVEGSSLWFYIGVLATTYETSIAIVPTVSVDEPYLTLSRASVSIVVLLYDVSLLCQPRRRSPKDMWKLRLHFFSFAVIGEMAWAVYEFREGGEKL